MTPLQNILQKPQKTLIKTSLNPKTTVMTPSQKKPVKTAKNPH
jgi:hypothetical protein